MYLKPCPFCGSREIEVWEVEMGVAGLKGEYYALCTGCFSESGARTQTKREAAQAWNTRSYPTKEKR